MAYRPVFDMKRSDLDKFRTDLANVAASSDATPGIIASCNFIIARIDKALTDEFLTNPEEFYSH